MDRAAQCIIENNELLELLPHRGKMLLISRITEYDVDAGSLRSEYDAGKNCLFYDPALEGIPAYACFEFMAQAVSVLSGIKGKILNRPPMIGFILSIASLKIERPLFMNGDVIEITVNEEQRIDNVSVFKCTAFVCSSEAVQAKLMVMDIEDPTLFLEGKNE